MSENNAPERIYLQWHGDADPAIEGWPENAEYHCLHGDVSWCWHSIFEHDVVYIRADLADAAIADYNARATELRQAADRYDAAVANMVAKEKAKA